MNNYEIKGYFWLPNNPNHKVAGNLEIMSHKIINLELLGLLQNLTDTVNDNSVQLDIILGISSEGKKLTLYKNFRKSTTIGTSIPSSEYLTEYIFIGCHVSSRDDLIFEDILVNYKFLTSWIKRRRLNIDVQSTEGALEGFSITTTTT